MNYEELDIEISRCVRAERRKRKWTQDGMAMKLHMHTNTYRSRERNLSPWYLYEVAQVCDLFHWNLNRMIEKCKLKYTWR